MNGLDILQLTKADGDAAFQVFQAAIPEAFEKEGLGFMTEEIQNEILHKKHMIDSTLSAPNAETIFLIAKLNEEVIGAISFGPCGEDIKKCTENQLQHVGELGSLFILPEYQGQGVGSALIHEMAVQLSKKGVQEFCLDSGYKRAQKRWLRKFGEPIKVAKDYWGPDADHMIWLCKVANYL